MSRLDRYVFREALGPLALGFMLYTFILFMQFLFDSAEMIIRRDVPPLLVGKLFALNLPHIIVLTIPMALLFAILIAIGRLAADSELVAMRASGISLSYLYRALFALSALLASATCFLMIYALPRGNSALQKLTIEIATMNFSQNLKPRVFYEELEDKVLYVFETPPGERRLRGVFLTDAIPKRQNQLTVAEWGEVDVEKEGQQVILKFTHAVEHGIDFFESPDEYEVRSLAEARMMLEDQFFKAGEATSSQSADERLLTLPQLLQMARSPARSEEERNKAKIEIHKKFAIPMVCLVFALFAVPLGFNNRRGGKSSGFTLSIVVILGYYVLLNSGEEAAILGHISPWLAMWLPNMLLCSLGLVLRAQKNRDRGLLAGRLDRWIQRHLWTHLLRWKSARQARRLRRQASHAGRSDVLVRLPRPRMRFPNLIDRYVVRLFFKVFFVVLMAGMVVYVVADFADFADDILKNRAETQLILSYYQYLSLQIFYDIAPVVVLITTLVAFGLLSRTSEITAAKALGVSLYRLSVPVVGCALVVAITSGILETTVLPASNGKVAEIRDRIKGRTRARTYRRADQQWLYSEGGSIYNYMHFDSRRKSLQRLQIFRFDKEHRLAGRLYANTARYVDGGWIVRDGWARSFDGARLIGYDALPGPVEVDIPELPDFFAAEVLSPERMNYPSFKTYVQELKQSGQDVPELEVELQNKIAIPVVCLVMALVALPFAFRLGKAGALSGIGLALGLGMVFYAVIAFFTTLGEAAVLPPEVAVWSPNVLFGVFSLYLFLGVKT